MKKNYPWIKWLRCKGKKKNFHGKKHHHAKQKTQQQIIHLLAYIFHIKDISYLAQHAIKWRYRCKLKGNEINLFCLLQMGLSMNIKSEFWNVISHLFHQFQQPSNCNSRHQTHCQQLTSTRSVIIYIWLMNLTAQSMCLSTHMEISTTITIPKLALDLHSSY